MSVKRKERLLRTVTLMVAPLVLALVYMSFAKALKPTVCEGKRAMVISPGRGVDDAIARANLHGNIGAIRLYVAKLNSGVNLSNLQLSQQIFVPRNCE